MDPQSPPLHTVRPIPTLGTVYLVPGTLGTVERALDTNCRVLGTVYGAPGTMHRSLTPPKGIAGLYITARHFFFFGGGSQALHATLEVQPLSPSWALPVQGVTHLLCHVGYRFWRRPKIEKLHLWSLTDETRIFMFRKTPGIQLYAPFEGLVPFGVFRWPNIS